jgi:hypothetical protein
VDLREEAERQWKELFGGAAGSASDGQRAIAAEVVTQGPGIVA